MAKRAKPTNFPNGLRRAREAKGWSLEKFGEMAGRDWRTLQRYETGARAVAAVDLVELAGVLGVDPAQVLSPDPFLADDELTLLKLYRSLTASERRQLLGIAKTFRSEASA